MGEPVVEAWGETALHVVKPIGGFFPAATEGTRYPFSAVSLATVRPP